jgi:hypothetical protein
MPSKEHREGDINPPIEALQAAKSESVRLIERFKEMCPCECE